MGSVGARWVQSGSGYVETAGGRTGARDPVGGVGRCCPSASREGADASRRGASVRAHEHPYVVDYRVPPAWAEWRA